MDSSRLPRSYLARNDKFCTFIRLKHILPALNQALYRCSDSVCDTGDTKKTSPGVIARNEATSTCANQEPKSIW